ncbi:MAG: hypothetical protein ACHQU0_00760 [Candidatus Paceibacteria bacterium]
MRIPHFKSPTIPIIVVGVVSGAIFLMSYLIYSEKQSARIASNRAALEQCRTEAKCLTGFVQWAGTKNIYRITKEPNGPRTISPNNLTANMDAWEGKYLDLIEKVVLPDTPEWYKWNTQYQQEALTAIP